MVTDNLTPTMLQYFFTLLGHTRDYLFASLSTSMLAVGSGLGTFVLTQAIKLKRRHWQWRTMTTEWKQNLRDGVIAAVIVWGGLICWSVFRTVYYDHVSSENKVTAITADEKTLESKIKLLEEIRPDLKWTYELVQFGEIRLDNAHRAFPGGANVIVSGDIINGGKMPTIVKNWQLNVRLSSENQFHLAHLIGFSKAKELDTGPAHRHSQELLFQKAYLPDLTATNAIVPGDSRIGFVVFGVDGITTDQLLAAGNSLTLSFEDAQGRPYHFAYRTSGEKHNYPVYIPGMPKPQ